MQRKTLLIQVGIHGYRGIEEDALLNALNEMVSKGEKIENSLTSGCLRECYLSAVALPGTAIRATSQISSKLKVWKKKISLCQGYTQF